MGREAPLEGLIDTSVHIVVQNSVDVLHSSSGVRRLCVYTQEAGFDEVVLSARRRGGGDVTESSNERPWE